jgi:hypothetical protein
MRIASVTGEYLCPESQRLDNAGEERHRQRQLAQNVAGVARALDASIRT